MKAASAFYQDIKHNVNQCERKNLLKTLSKS